MTTLTPEMEALKARIKATWTAGDFGQIAKSYVPARPSSSTASTCGPGDEVLDVACGTGNLAVPAAEDRCQRRRPGYCPQSAGTGPGLGQKGGPGHPFDENDAEALPYDGASFDAVMTMFGAMFTPRPDVTAAELARTCRKGGRIAMANWTPGGFIGQMFKIVGKYVPSAPGMPSPLLWGDEGIVRERFAGSVADLQLTRRSIDLISSPSRRPR